MNKKRVVILQELEDYKKAIFRIMQATLRHEKYDGSMSGDIVRLSLERGDGVAAIIHHVADDTLVFTEQFRYPTYHKSNDGWLVELPAGIVEDSEDPKDTMRREIEEETGYDVRHLEQVYSFYLSPGGSSERIFLFYGQLDSDIAISQGGGLDEEHEDIRTFRMTVDEALQALADQKFHDAKTIIGLQWLASHRDELPTLGEQNN